MPLTGLHPAYMKPRPVRIKKMTRLLFCCLSVFFLHGPLVLAQELDVPYYVTEPEVVEGMLDMAGVGPGDYLIDLGSGDGRIVIAAARRGAVGHGVDLDPRRNEVANRNALEAGVADRVVFLEQDLFETDFSQATVVTMFLLSAVNLRLRPELLSRLRPGTRVLSHTFDMGDWRPDRREVIGIRPVYLWIIPARVDGTWEWTTGGSPFTMVLQQQFQEIDAAIKAEGRNLAVEEAELNGGRITLLAVDDAEDVRYLFHGVAGDDSITGTLHIHHNRDPESPVVEKWTARRRRSN
jgi:SAM-dependent methyltransferase